MTPLSKPPAKSSVYHRFIPREEVQDVAAWAFDAMDSKSRAAADSAAAEAAQPELPAVDLEAERQRAYAEGFEHGRKVGEKETRDALDAPLRRTAEDAAKRLAALMKNAQQQLEASEDQLAVQMLELACDIARQVVRQELTQPLDAMKAVVTEALAATVKDELARVLRLNPMDFALLQNHIDPLLQDGKLKLVADEAITAGGCVLETAASTIDATVEKRWTRAVANLGMKARWNDAPEPPPTDAEADRG